MAENGNDTFNLNLDHHPLTINTAAGANTLLVPTMNNIQHADDSTAVARKR